MTFIAYAVVTVVDAGIAEILVEPRFSLFNPRTPPNHKLATIFAGGWWGDIPWTTVTETAERSTWKIHRGGGSCQ